MQRNSNEELPEPQANYTISDQAREVEQLATSSLAQHEAAFAIRAPLGAHANKRVKKMNTRPFMVQVIKWN